VRNDPLNQVDPTGRLAFLIPAAGCALNPSCRAAVGAGIGAAAGAITSTYREATDGRPGINLGEVGEETLKGGIVGAVGGATLNPHATAGAAATVEFTDRAIDSALAGNSASESIAEGTRGAISAATESYAGGIGGSFVSRQFPSSDAAETVAGAVLGPAVESGTTGVVDATSDARAAASQSYGQAARDATAFVERGCMQGSLAPQCQ
jgi:hypothetical protein